MIPKWIPVYNKHNSDCAAGWTYFPHSQHCYRHFQAKLIFWDARTECRKYGTAGSESLCDYHQCATLASIHDEETNNFLVSLTAQGSIQNSRNWIGGIYTQGTKKWTWDDTSSFNYKHFARGYGEPDYNAIFLEFYRCVPVSIASSWKFNIFL